MSPTTDGGGKSRESSWFIGRCIDFGYCWEQSGRGNYLSLSQRRFSMKRMMMAVMAVMCLAGFGSLSFAEDMGSMKGEMKEMKGEMKSKMTGKHDEMKGEMKAKHDQMKGEMKEMKGEMKEMKDEMKDMKGEMKGEMKGAMGK
jgi:septin family protein